MSSTDACADGARVEDAHVVFIGLAVAVIIDTITCLRCWLSRLGLTDGTDPIRSAPHSACTSAGAFPCETQPIQVGKCFVNFAVTVVVEAVTKLVHRVAGDNGAVEAGAVIGAVIYAESLVHADADDTHFAASFEAFVRLAIAVIIDEITQLFRGGIGGADWLWTVSGADQSTAAGDHVAVDIRLTFTDLSKAEDVIGEAIAVIVDLITNFRRGLRGRASSPTELSITGLPPDAGSEPVGDFTNPHIPLLGLVART